VFNTSWAKDRRKQPQTVCIPANAIELLLFQVLPEELELVGCRVRISVYVCLSGEADFQALMSMVLNICVHYAQNK
jgi:hypothetical protein